MIHFTITAPIDLQQACSEIWIRPDVQSSTCEIPPLQKSRHGNNSCDPEESTRLEDIQYIARTIPHTGTWPGPSTGPRSAEALTCRPPPRTGCCILRQEQQPPAHTAIRTSSVRNSPASKHGALKICSYGDIPRFLPRWILAVRPIYGIPGPLHGVLPK